jgi:hypothetical protein
MTFWRDTQQRVAGSDLDQAPAVTAPTLISGSS